MNPEKVKALFGPGPWHVEERTNAYADVCDSRGRVLATCGWSSNAAERARVMVELLAAAVGDEQ